MSQNEELNTDPNTIELLALFCRRSSIWRVPGQVLGGEYSSLLIFPVYSTQFEPEWIQLPGLYLLSEGLDEFRRARIRCNEESFVVTAHEALPACPEFKFFSFAMLFLTSCGDLAEFELRTSPGDPFPIRLGREYVHVLMNCTQDR